MLSSKTLIYTTLISSLLSSFTLLAGCGTMNTGVSYEQVEQQIQKPTQELTTSLSEQLVKYDWQLHDAVDVSGASIAPLTSIKKQVTLDFYLDKRGHSLGFSVGCNGYGANYQLNETGKLMTEFVIGTEMYCEQLNTAERKLAKFMKGNSQLSFKQDAQTPMLTQTTANGSILTWHGRLKNDVKYGQGETVFLEVAPKTEYCSSGINQQCLKVRNVYYDENSIKSDYSDWRLMKNPIEGYTHDSSTRQILRVKKYITDPIDVKGKQLVYVLDMTVETETVK